MSVKFKRSLEKYNSKRKKTIISANNNFPFSMSNTPAAISRDYPLLNKNKRERWEKDEQAMVRNAENVEEND